jgi:hypothetical protein
MSLSATRWSWVQKVPPTAKLVLLSLADRADNNNCCYPSTKRIEIDTGLYRETIHTAIATLESMLIIRVERRFGSSNRYYLNVVDVEENQSAKADRLEEETSRQKPPTVQKTSRQKPIGLSEPISENDENQSALTDYCIENQSAKAATESISKHINTIVNPKQKKITLKTFLENGGSIDPASNATFKYAQKIGLPEDFLYLSWVWFKQKYAESDKTYIDWLKAWDNAVRGNWAKAWWLSDTDGYVLTTTGKQIQKEIEHE